MTLHVMQYSGGIGSWATAQRIAERHGTDNLVLLFADVQQEDDDLYRFLDDTAHHLGVPLTVVADGRNPWQLFRDQRYLGNSRLAPCSWHLKIRPCRTWLDTHADPNDTILYVGLDTSPKDLPRAPGIRAGWAPWTVQFPLHDRPHLTKDDQLAWARKLGLTPPRLYDLGYAHNNCGGLCIRAGKKQWAHTLTVFPDRYAHAEVQERLLREQLGDVTILTEQRAGVRHRLTLTALRERVTAGGAP